MNNQEINQINKKTDEHLNHTITALPNLYNLILCFILQAMVSRIFYYWLMFKAVKHSAYLSSNSSGEKTLNVYNEFMKDVEKFNAVERDHQFSFEAFQEFNEKNNIRLDTSIAKDEHISKGGNKLDIIDRLVKTLNEMISKHKPS